MGEFKVKFWGVRGSHCVPGKDTVRIGGNSTCLEINAGGNEIIFDAGTGMINLGRELRKRYQDAAAAGQKNPVTAYLFFTHTHHDHTEGFPFFEPAYFGTTTMYVFGPRLLSQDLETVLEHAMIPPFFPITMEDMGSTKVFQNITEKNAVIINGAGAAPVLINKFMDKPVLTKDAVKIGILKNYSHPRDGVLVYSIEYDKKKVVFATDVEGYLGGDQRLINFSKGADLLIHDAQYTRDVYADKMFPKQGWGHSTVDMAAEAAKMAEAKKLAIFHHDPQDTDQRVDEKEKLAKKLFGNAVAAYEGLEIIV